MSTFHHLMFKTQTFKRMHTVRCFPHFFLSNYFTFQLIKHNVIQWFRTLFSQLFLLNLSKYINVKSQIRIEKPSGNNETFEEIVYCIKSV